MSIYRSAVSKPVTTLLIFLAFAIMGVFSLFRLPIDFFPNIESNVLMVITAYPGASAEDVENNLTKQLENTLNSVSDLKNLSSQSRENISIITVEFKYGTDIDLASNDVRDKLDMVSSYLRDGASTPILYKFSADDMPILILSATATESVTALDKILDDDVATPLARISGVGTVSVTGAPKREIHVYVDPDQMAAYGVNMSTIAAVIGAENRNVPSGNLDVGSNTYSLRIKKEFSDPDELKDLVIGYSRGNAVYLKDVARIEDGVEERTQESYTNGVRGAQIIIQKQSGSNTVEVIREVRKKLEEIKPNLPNDIKFTEVMNTSDNIENTINSLFETIMITFFVVMLVVFVFLGRWRGTLIVVLSIPIALLASLMYLFFTGNSLNIISMSALSIAIGMVVDDAIVVLENVTSHLERGEKPKEAAVHGTSEVGISVIASTLTMLCVFLPLTMVSGLMGIIFKQMGWMVSIIMIVSTTAALTLVPMMCSQMLDNSNDHGKLYRIFFTPINKVLDGISRGYSRLIGWCMRHKVTVFIVAVAAFVLTIGLLAPRTKTEFFPSADQGRLSLTLEMPVGTSQDVTAEVAARIYDRISAEVPEVKILSYSFGQADTDNAFASMQSNGTHLISMRINLGTKTERIASHGRSTADIADQIRLILRDFPELSRSMVSEGNGIGGASSIRVEVYGYDFRETENVARQLQQHMAENPTFSQITLSRDQYTPEYQVDFDREKLAINGLTSTQAAAAVSAAMSGTVASLYREEGEEYNIRVRYAPEFRRTDEDLENIIVYNPLGKGIRIKDLGRIVEDEVPPTIERKNRERLITLTGIVAQGYALSDAVAGAETAISESDIPRNVTCELAGDYQDQQEMFSDMGLLIALIVILVYMVMASQFESFLGPFVIMFSIPFALVGVYLGLWATGTALGMMAMVGIVILLGIVVKNGIVLIDYTILCQERGMDVRAASIEAAKSRLRPILMTTLTTVLGMIPMAIGTKEGAEMWNSLGMAVVWGLSISTLVTLVLIPTLYCLLSESRTRRRVRKAARRARKAAKA